MMGTKEVLSVLILVAGILLSDRCVNGQPAPPSSMAAGQGMCATVPGVEELKVLLSNGDWPDVCSYSTLQYACAGVGNVSSEKISSILECSLKSEDNVKQIEFAVLFSYLSLDILETSINRLNNIVDASSIKAEVKGNLLNAVWEKLQENVEQFSPGFLATWFQNILYFAISAFDPRILDDMTRLNITCNGLEAVVGALDVARAMYDNDTRKEIGKGITRFVQAHSCKKGSPSETMKSFYKGFMRDLEYKDLVVAWGDQDLSKSLPMLTELQMAEYIDTNKAFSNVEEASPVLVQLDTKDLSFITSVLKHLTTDDSTYNMEVMFSLLNITLGKFNSADDSYCRPTFKTIFQGNVAILAINDIILEQLIIRDCSEYQDTYLTVDRVYDKLSDEVKESVCKNRLKYLNEEASKTGSGCTYGLTSVEWFEKIIGRSKDLVSYSDMMRLNSNFEGYGVILSLNNKQTSDMIVQSNLLTDQFPKDMEIRLAPVITYIKNKDFTSLQDTLKELSLRLSQAGIKYIANVQVRNVLLRTIWGIAEKQFSLFTANDWNMWFSDYMTLLFPSITSGQLAALSNSVVKNCSNFQIIVGGLDIAFNNMSQDTRTEVVNWIISYLLKETDSCKGDDMLNVNFRQFKNMTDIDVFLKIYPGLNPLDVLHELSSRQLGQVAATNVELRTNVIIVQEVFSVLTIGSDEEDLVNVGTFWDSFNEADNEITVEVQYKMLQLTTDVISSHLTEMSSEDITLWYEGRLTSVIDVIDKDILAKFPLTVGCDSYKAFAHALSVSYTDTLEASKEDVLDFMVNFLANGTNCEATHTSSVSYIESSFGSYSSMATYEEITSYYAGFNAFESGVLQILTVTQIGDMIVESNIYESLEKSTELFDYLKTISVKHVDACMTQFTETSIKKKIEITNVEVGQYFLKSYLEMKKQDQPYTHEELKHLFEFRIYKLMQFFTSGTLLMLGIKDCDALVNVVAYLDSGYDYMSEEIKSEISAWIIGLLKSLNFNGCRSISQSSSVWKEIIFKRFFQYTTMKEVLEVYPSFDVLAVINDTSSTQKGEYLVTSDALQDVEKTKTVLESLPGADGVVSVNEIYKFLDAVNNNYNEQLVQTMSPAVREECMTILFSHLLENLDALNEVQISNIQEKFKYFLPGVTYTVLQKIPLSMDCNSYSIIFGAISSVFDKLSTAIAQALCNRNLDFLNATSDGSSAVCSSSYTDSKSYMEKIFLNCSSSATLNEMKRYYPKFDAFDVLEKLTAAQMGNLFMNSMAYRDTTAAVLVMAELGKRGYKEMTSFMTECTKVAKEKNLGRLPDPSIRSLMFNTVWKPISVNLRTAEDYMWLRDNCYLVIASITTTDIQSLDVNIDCESQSYMVQAFSNVFGQLGDEQNQAVYDKIKDYNKAKAASGSACDAGNSAEWIKTYYGSYKGYPTLTELKDANSNFNATEALDELSGVQTADYIVENGMLWDAIAIAVMINVRKDPGDLEQFLNRLNTVAPTELQNSPAAGVILATTFEKLSGNFMYFKREDWKQWMQETLANILYTVNVTQLDLIPIPLPCDSYQEVVKGLDKAFPLMKKETRKDVYTQCMKRQLDSTVSPNGVSCGEKTDRPQDWIDANLGQYAEFPTIADFKKWIPNLQIMDVINTLSSSQMAEVTIQQINNEEVACQIAGRLQQFGIADVYIYLDTCYELYLQLNKPKLINTDIGLEILSSCIPTIKNELPSYSLSDWEALCVRLKPFIHSINNEQLSALLASADSDGYTTIIRCMSEAFDGFTQDILESLYEVIQGYLNNHMSDSGVFPVSGEDSSAAVTRVLGKFSVFTSYGDLQRFISNFNGVSAVPILSPQQMADCALSGDVLSNEAKAQAIIAAVSNLSFIQLEIFLSSFQATAEQKNIVSLPNLKIRGFLFSAIYAKVIVQFYSFTDDQFMDYFFGKLNLLLPSMTASHFQQIPDSINCAAFRIIIAACSSHYKVLSEVDKKGISDQALTYLKTQKMSTGSACPTNTGNSGELLNSNFGLFSEYVTLGDILQLYEDFDCLSAVKYFTPMQLALCTVNSDALTDKDKMAKCTDETNSDTIGYFMDAFNDGLSQKGITELPNVQVKKFILGEVFCKLRPILPSFTTTDCTNWFQERLKLFRDSIDAKQLSYLSDSSCDCLSAIMGGLNEAENPENPGSVCDFVIQALQKKKSDTGAACTGNGLDSGVWLVKYFGKYSASAEWSDIFYLNANFQVVENADKLTPVQLAKACTNTNIIRNVTAIDIVVSTFTGRVSDYQSFLETVRDVVLKDSSLMPNKKVCGSFLMGAANIMFKGVPELSLEQTKHLVTTMDYLLPSINATVLEKMPMDISCKQYQILVEGIVQNFGISPIQMKKDIIAFQLTFLNEKVVTDGDACSAGIRNSAQYAEKNFGESCSMIPAEGVAAIYPLIDQIHFTQYCSLS